MRGKKNKLLKQSFCIIGLITSISIEADSSLNSSLNKHQETFENAAMQIWNWAEVGYQEYKSAKLLKDELKANGFTIQSGVADIPTAFIAEFSNGGPVIGILGEYDALPGLMQTASPFKEPRDDVIAGHACGHHMFGAASAWAAVTIKEWLVKTGTKGTIRFYGIQAALMLQMPNHPMQISQQNLGFLEFQHTLLAHLTKADLLWMELRP